MLKLAYFSFWQLHKKTVTWTGNSPFGIQYYTEGHKMENKQLELLTENGTKRCVFWQLLIHVFLRWWLTALLLHYRRGHRSIFYKFCGPLAKELSAVKVLSRCFTDTNSGNLRLFFLSCGRVVHLKIFANKWSWIGKKPAHELEKIGIIYRKSTKRCVWAITQSCSLRRWLTALLGHFIGEAIAAYFTSFVVH